MVKPVKDTFLDVVELWEKYWNGTSGLYGNPEKYMEINDDFRTHVIKKRKKKIDTL